MSTGTGIFLAALVIGLVMLYGHTKDRWNWRKVWKYVGIGIVFLIILIAGIIYRVSNNLNVLFPDWSGEGFLSVILIIFAFGIILMAVYRVMEFIYGVLLKKDWEFDEDYNETKIKKFIDGFLLITLAISIIFFPEHIKPYMEPIISSFNK